MAFIKDEQVDLIFKLDPFEKILKSGLNMNLLGLLVVE